MLCTECSLIDIGDVFPLPRADVTGLTKAEPHWFWAASGDWERPRDDGADEFRFHSPVPHGKTFSQMRQSGAQGCELCKHIVAWLEDTWDPPPPADGADGARMFRWVESAHYRSDSTSTLQGPYRVRRLHFNYGCFEDEVKMFGSGSGATVELFVEPGHVLAETGEMECVGVRAADDPTCVRNWLSLCRSKHQWCRTPKRKLPTRILDVEPWPGADYARLVIAAGCDGDYVALSHCWGSSPVNKTTKASTASHTRGIQTSSLCKTFRDAIQVTRSLGLRYLWIDALCIIQDDDDDWRREAETMADVYANATVVLAATASSDGDGGLFHTRFRPSIDSALKWTRSGSLTPEPIYWRESDSHRFYYEVLCAPLNQRGWVVQERTLSTRIVHFARSQLFWECQETTVAENNVPCANTSFVAVRPASLLAVGPLTSQAWDQEDMDTVWRETIRRYTGCQLSFQSDKLVAIAGIAKAWARSCGDRYVCGLWQSTLPLDLLWKINLDEGQLPASRLPFPTWSWASVTSRVKFLWAGNPSKNQPQRPDFGSTPDTYMWPRREDYESLITDLQVSVNDSQTESYFSTIRTGILFMTAHTKSAFLQRDTHGGIPKDTIILQDIGTDKILPSGFIQEIDYDFNPPSALHKAIPTVLLFRTTRQTNQEQVIYITDHFMLLEQQQDPDHYKRIGVGEIGWYADSESIVPVQAISWFCDADKRRIRIS